MGRYGRRLCSASNFGSLILHVDERTRRTTCTNAEQPSSKGTTTGLVGFFCNGCEVLEMSEYVEARYAKLVLREARLANEDTASKLVNGLLRDLGSLQRPNSARAQAVTSIRLLALSLDQPHVLHVREWEAAYQAAEAWCQNAYH